MDMNDRIRAALARETVGIAGCGGLGSNCAVALARCGIGRLVVADFDVVSVGNLNRQYFFRDQVGQNKALALRDIIARIDPAVRVEAHDIRLDPAAVCRLFRDCRVIVEAFDLAEMKQMIIETVLEEISDTPIVSGSGLAGWGWSNELHERSSGRLFICGDESREVSPDLPPLAPRVAIVAGMQANRVLEILLGECPSSSSPEQHP